MIEALSHNDALAQLALFILLIVFIYRVTTQPSKPCHALWFSGIIMLIPVVFLATREPAVAVGPYVSTFALVAAGLLAAGFIAAIDRTAKLSAYYLMYLTAVSIVYAYAFHYGERHVPIIGIPAFWALVVPNVALLVWLPLKMAAAKITSWHSGFISLGTILAVAAGYVMWAVNAERLVIAEDWVNPVTYTLLFGGLLFILLGFVLARQFLAGHTAPADAAAGQAAGD